MAHIVKRIIKKIVPTHTKPGRILKNAAASVGLAKPLFFNEEYKQWIDYVEPEMFLPVLKYNKKNKPLFSIIIPFFNTPDKYLFPLIDSIANQSFADWELIVADASTNTERTAAIKYITSRDKRMKYHRLEHNGGISENTNAALQVALGEYVIFTDHDDILNSHALNEIAAKISEDASVDILYSDEDKLSDDGKWRHSPFFKPDWSPHLFLYTNYTNHLSVIRRTLVEKAGGLRKECDGSQDYDLLLRIHSLSKDSLNVVHIPKVLYHWREAAGSTAVDYKHKAYAFEAGRKALSDYLDTMEIKGTVESIKETPGFFRQYLQPHTIKNVHIIVDLQEGYLQNDSLSKKLRDLTSSNLNVTFYSGRLEFDNQKKQVSEDAIVVEITQYVLPGTSDWLNQLAGLLELSDVAAVAPRIITANKQRVVDMGLVKKSCGELVKLYYKNGEKDLTINGGVNWVRDVDALSGVVIAYRFSQGKDRKKNQYYVVWSHVDFIHYPLSAKSTYFNNNLQILNDGRVTVDE